MFQKTQIAQSIWRSTRPYTVRKMVSQHPQRMLLLVDDDVQVLRVACRLLEDEWEIHTAHNATEAAGILKTTRFDTVLTDFEMPGEDGIWLLREVRRTNPKTRRVLFSGSPPGCLSEHLNSGLVECFIPKPTSRADLVSSLRK